MTVGATVKFTEKSMLEGFVGYTNQTFLADGSSTPAFTFGLTGSWNGYEPLTIRPAFMRSINEFRLQQLPELCLDDAWHRLRLRYP